MERYMTLTQTIKQNKDPIRARLRLGRAHWDALVESVDHVEANGSADCHDEQLWTFLLACAYAVADDGPSDLACRMTDSSMKSDAVWFEVLPRSPRFKEGLTNLDLALGDLVVRNGTDSGIELASGSMRKALFCEFKWHSDIAHAVSRDQHRNQLARVIENALFFRSATGEFAECIHVCLVTPRIFRDGSSASRFYRYKWRDYDLPGREELLTDLQNSRLETDPSLPTAQERLSALSLSWRSYEELLFASPDTQIRNELRKFYETYRGTELESWPAG
jgi:hypothetical protein